MCMKMNPPNGKVITDYFLHNSSSSQETYFFIIHPVHKKHT